MDMIGQTMLKSCVLLGELFYLYVFELLLFALAQHILKQERIV